jgi:3-oxoacyl-[acyl-carrier-protein] synthase I
MPHSAILAGAGAQCSIGLNLPAITAAVDGKLNVFRFDKRIRSQKNGAPIACAWLETFSEDCSAHERMKAMMTAAAKEALETLTNTREISIPVLLALPAPRPGIDQKALALMAREIIQALPMAADKKACSLLFEGHAGGITLVQHAKQLLSDGKAPAVLLGGGDSYRDLETLRFIEATGRLRTEDDPLGWTPGEGAAFLLLTTPEQAARFEIPETTSLESAAVSLELRPWYSGRATIGEALTQVLQDVFEAPGEEVETYCDMNGDPWRADEWGYAYLRTAGHYVNPLVLRHPADCWGDLGAASAPMLIALAGEKMKQHEKSSRSLVWTASDTRPLRGACVISKRILS